MENLSKTDDVLFELDQAVATYLKSIPSFKYKNKTFHLVDDYVAVPHMSCDLCGNYPLFEVSVIESDDGEKLYVGNGCINNLTKRNISKWFEEFRRKRESVKANRKYINSLSKIVEDYNKNRLSVDLTVEDVKKITTMLQQVYNGQALTTDQIQIAEHFVACYVTA